MSGRNYYALVAGLKEYALDADTKGFDARAIVGAILDEVSDSDAREVRLLYGYYDCENLAALRAGRKPRNPLGNLAPDELEEELRHPARLPRRVADVVRAYGDPEGEEAEERDMNVRFEAALFEAYYAECAASCANGRSSTATCATSPPPWAPALRAVRRTRRWWAAATWPRSCAAARPPTSDSGASCPVSMR